MRLSEINYGECSEESSDKEEKDQKSKKNLEGREMLASGTFQSMNSAGSFSNGNNMENSHILGRTEKCPSNYSLLSLPNVYPYFHCWFYPN